MINHGHWVLYAPNPYPEHAPAGAVFWKNAEGADWYEWSRARWSVVAGVDASGTIKIAVVGGSVCAVGADVTALSVVNDFDLYEAEPGDSIPGLGWSAIEGGFVEPTSLPAPPPSTITRRQCAAELFAEGLITGPEAIAMTATATPPTIVEAVLSTIGEPDQTFARLEFAAANYDRTNALIGTMMTALGKSDDDRDNFFRAAGTR